LARGTIGLVQLLEPDVEPTLLVVASISIPI
jgi:hypothetical protein